MLDSVGAYLLIFWVAYFLMKLHQMYLFKCGKNPHLPFLIDFAFSLDWQNVKKKIRISSFSKHSSFYFCKLNLPEFVNNISVLIIQRDCKRSIFFPRQSSRNIQLNNLWNSFLTTQVIMKIIHEKKLKSFTLHLRLFHWPKY